MKPDETFPDVDVVSLTGGATSLGLRRQLTAFPNARIYAMYGLTECKRVAYLDPAEFLTRPNSCGKPMAGVTGTIVDTEGNAVEPGVVGELTIEGENVCPGYWADPVVTRKRFRRTDDGRLVLFTGDRFRRDENGYLEFISRNDEQVKIRDERVNLGTIERELRSSRLVLDLALRIELDDLGIPILTASIVPESPSGRRGGSPALVPPVHQHAGPPPASRRHRERNPDQRARTAHRGCERGAGGALRVLRRSGHETDRLRRRASLGSRRRTPERHAGVEFEFAAHSSSASRGHPAR